MNETSFGEWLKRQRKTAGWTQEQLARQVHCSTITLRKLESGERRPSEQVAARLAEIFHLAPEERDAFLRFARRGLGNAPASTSATPWRPAAPRSNLPAAVTSLVGREKELVELQDYLQNASIRLVSLVGPPGIGKTRLSVEVGRAALSEFPDGVFFVALAPLNDPALIELAVIQALDFAAARKQPLEQQLFHSIGDKKMLLLLDNCEHLIEEAARLVSDLLSACPRLKILVTSREALRVPGEWLYPVPALDVPAEGALLELEAGQANFSALTLFAERARAVRPDFRLTAENISAVAAICAQLDGLPLAIELLAPRIRLMSPQSLLKRMSADFVLSADGMRAVPARQKTLNNAIGWSYNLLSPEEQIFFARLSVFLGGWTLESAKAICGGDVLNLTNSLLKKSLIMANPMDGHETRYRFHETIGQFAREKLRASGEMKMYCLRHLTYFAEMVAEAEGSFKGADQALWYNRLDDEQDNLRGALTCFDGIENAEVRLRLAAGLWRYWKNRGLIREGRMHLKNILESIPLGPHRQISAYARALTASGSLAYYEGDMSYSEQSRKEALAIFRNLEDKTGIADCLNGLGNIAISQGDYDPSRRFYEESLMIRKELDDRWGVARLLGNLGLLAYFQGDYGQARSLHLESLALFRELGNDEGVVNELVNLGDVFYCQGDLPTASSFYEESALIARKLKDHWGLAYAIKGMADVVFRQGDLSTASSLYGECITAFHKGADYMGLPFAFESIAALACAKKKFDAAARIFGVADALRQSSNSPVPPPNHDAYQMNLSILHQQLDPGQFESAWVEGRAMTLAEAVAYALEEIL